MEGFILEFNPQELGWCVTLYSFAILLVLTWGLRYMKVENEG